MGKLPGEKNRNKEGKRKYALGWAWPVDICLLDEMHIYRACSTNSTYTSTGILEVSRGDGVV